MSCLRLWRHEHLRAWVLWGLIFTLPIYGVSGLVTQWLGAQHFHSAESTKRVERIAAVTQSNLVVRGHGHGHQHAHTSLARHHHETGDASVVALGADSPSIDSDSGYQSGSVLQVVALSNLASLYLRAGLSHAEPAAQALRASDGMSRLLERPPKA